ncbi:hypothetical protein AcV7_005825 [Taiwanofungus camphoratus]|nr:hypothetical protein AcW2_007088 [Antrodia cinnamomea]KAI0923265.1 hypothetical protein AcV7_005825 [Antrodia cinnamomea]
MDQYSRMAYRELYEHYEASEDGERFEEGNLDDIISEDDLPFTRIKLTFEEEEEELEQAWVVNIPDPRQITMMLAWLKWSELETPSMAHLKRIRRQESKTTLLLTFASGSPAPPLLPESAKLPSPYVLAVPRSAALTPTSLKLKSTFWPTVYTPRRKGEAEKWSRGRTVWACEAMRHVVGEARQAQEKGELPIAAYVPIPYDEQTRSASQMLAPILAHDTRNSTVHPLRHAILNIVRAVAAYRVSNTGNYPRADYSSLPSQSPPLAGLSCSTSSTIDLIDSVPTPRNGAHYLLTSLTVFTTHEPCIMCSMALLHSRVKEVFYLMPMEATGGCGGVACLPMMDGINHRFSISRWKTSQEWNEYLRIDSAVDA